MPRRWRASSPRGPASGWPTRAADLRSEPQQRALDLRPLRFGLTTGHRIWATGLLRQEAPDQRWLACWARMSLRPVDWSIRELGPDVVAIWLEVAEELMPG
jgi:hypothetical protein